ncbi:adenylate/guanylate cyclase domain-containing protein [Methylobacterium sp. J-088]|uniref:adenylate/guanylate cyclase domain-containing protein n=1 Tax=Methylobacterium sp. J-088 TaxID=2836664 RepID=UPI001FB88E23|nr:adenylate/guanylate cyclase domain-containing protein [Methylobacterium sp. J-088]MCJ2064679.1 adenylate/guanylate cyclase domain-containing protein [Methylobacterium sp. J-088]
MSSVSERTARQQRIMAPLLVAAILLGLAGLPLAVWLDLRGLSERMLQTQAVETGRIIDQMRSFYASDVVQAVNGATGRVITTHDYKGVPNAIPIPATLSLELGERISGADGAVKYRFISDLPFKDRKPHELDAFEARTLAELRAHPQSGFASETTGSFFDRQVRIAAPIRMESACVRCHNAHPLSPKTDWKVGDVRGIQEIVLHQSIAANVLAFKYLLGYFILAALAGSTILLLQARQSRLIDRMNRELTDSNGFLAAVSVQIAKYISPQVYKSIFSGERDVSVTTARKKLTIFFSDIKDFTATTERLQPEELTALLNEYFTEMTAIALRHGGTVDKYIGDAMLVFFGDPETRGVREDAQACVRMAIAMQQRLGQLSVRWRRAGIERPFQARMGINTGYCNVGNFGSDERMDYTIIGAEANLAARLQAAAAPGGITLSYETYALVSDGVRASPQEPIRMKGISRDVVPYAVADDSTAGDRGEAQDTVFSEHARGIDFYVDVDALEADGAARLRKRLLDTLAAVERRMTGAERLARDLEPEPHPGTLQRAAR